MEMLHMIQSLLTKENKKEVTATQKGSQNSDDALKTNENKTKKSRLSQEALMEIYGTVHMFI